ncbi:betaine-aldehyde dehydrogenase [Hoeflea prorocentri]|uniref:Betaine aldehyde dehydrogenase n=1 Tax=Hoeflea prorocentri TaxID=1922333 RepID=A0A9X3UM30_9HYPH|nr:betaine-aldehyde dehydrogenase [Hoeflea prorocentri]MCY6381576.1 betaine-aldehyde dehydrogenase [Hoeflea prorocentri]MDA5399376.1 betaine-aldehyde dehydrogenase [Hoeflea prorocentri]
MKAQPEASHFINGAFVEDTDGAVIDCIYPATGEVIARLHSATPAIIEQAIVSALDGQKIWAAMTGTERGRVLRRAADMIRERNQTLSELETYDTGKPLQETLVADATSGADALEYFGGLAAAINGEHIDLGGDFVYTRREPLGLCVGIGAWNYPTQIACWKGAPALACGNAMIFKPSETTPLCALEIASILHEAGLPSGVYNVVQGYGDVGATLTTHPQVDKVSLTGSVPTGQKVMAAAAAGIRHVTMELGGKSPLIVFNDANVEDAVGGALLGNFYSSGQVCSNGTRVFVQEELMDAFTERLIARTEAIRIGDPQDEATQMGPLVSAAQRDKVIDYIGIGEAEGANLATGGKELTLQGMENGFFVEPTVFTGVTDDMRIAREEIFGPVMSVLTFKDEDEVIARANDTEFGLSAGVFTQNLSRGHRAIAQLKAGSCWINTYNLAPVEAPFGGYKKSGVGRENSRAAIEYYSQIKSVYVATGPVDSPY